MDSFVITFKAISIVVAGIEDLFVVRNFVRVIKIPRLQLIRREKNADNAVREDIEVKLCSITEFVFVVQIERLDVILIEIHGHVKFLDVRDLEVEVFIDLVFR